MDRYPDCVHYDECLTEAAIANDEGMTCKGCPVYLPSKIIIESPQSEDFFYFLSQCSACSHMDSEDLLP